MKQIPLGICQCGCGQTTAIAPRTTTRYGHIAGQPFRFVRGHHKCLAVHGHTSRAHGKSPIYRSWSGMKDRCQNPNNPEFGRYGGRGITVCERWVQFSDFLTDMSPRPKGKWLDRINNDGNYEPGNCRWVTPKESQQNKTHRHTVSNIHRRRIGDSWKTRKPLVRNNLGQFLPNQ